MLLWLILYKIINLYTGIMYIIYYLLYISFTVCVHYLLLTVYIVYCVCTLYIIDCINCLLCVYICSALRLRRKIKYLSLRRNEVQSVDNYNFQLLYLLYFKVFKDNYYQNILLKVLFSIFSKCWLFILCYSVDYLPLKTHVINIQYLLSYSHGIHWANTW